MTMNTLRVKYKNWRGQIAVGTILPISIFYGQTEHHKQPQWLLNCFDEEKQAIRTYALKDCNFSEPYEERS